MVNVFLEEKEEIVIPYAIGVLAVPVFEDTKTKITSFELVVVKPQEIVPEPVRLVLQ